jgi:4'-phosphopantetheinyl transferase
VNSPYLRDTLCRIASSSVLAADEVHVWQFAFDRAQASTFGAVLGDSERERAARFRFAEDRARYVFARGALRYALAGYLSEAPARLHFVEGAWGKPALAPPAGDISFNVSHARDCVVFAFARHREVGVDVERIRPELDIARIGRRFFAQKEVDAIDRLPAAARNEAFFHVWSRKEAFIKGVGRGLSMPLDAFVVSVDPAASHVALDVADDPREKGRWSLASIRPKDGYVGALAVESRGAILGAPRVDDATVAGVAAQCIRWSLSLNADPRQLSGAE